MPWNWWKKAGAVIGVGGGAEKQDMRRNGQAEDHSLQQQKIEQMDNRSSKEPKLAETLNQQKKDERHQLHSFGQAKASENLRERRSISRCSHPLTLPTSATNSAAPRPLAVPAQPKPLSEASGAANWGPGELVLSDEAQHTSGNNEAASASLPETPWWSNAEDVSDSKISQKKTGLKPLQLASSVSGDGDAGSQSKSSNHHTQSNVLIPKTGPSSHKQAKVEEASPLSEQPIQTPPLRIKRKSRDLVVDISKRSSPPSSPFTPTSRARPPPSDLPESPASSKRFTKNIDQINTETISNPLPGSLSARKQRSKHDIIPVVPVAKSKQAAMSDTLPKTKVRKAVEARKPTVPLMKLYHQPTSPQDDWPSTPGPDEDDDTLDGSARKPLRKPHQTTSILQQQPSMSSEGSGTRVPAHVTRHDPLLPRKPGMRTLTSLL